MPSPYATGGGGTHLEARVASFALAAVLCEVPIRGLPGEFATRVRTQRGAFGDPLDDIIVDGVRGDARATRLDLQIKNKLTFTEGDGEWVEVLKRGWDTFSKPDFDPTTDRIGVGIGEYSAKADRHYQSVFNWAEHSADEEQFFERIAQGDYSHHDKQAFVRTVKAVLETHTDRVLSANELWRFLKAFVIIHYDFQSGAGSRDEANVVERLKGFLAPDQRDQAARIWDHLVAKACEMIPTGGGATRATLLGQLTIEGFTIGAAPSYWKDIEALQRESVRALGEIKSHIQGLKLHRAEAYQKVREALSEARFIQIDGEPGSGKSALLKELSEECARNGPVFVLKDGRIHPRGWVAHAHVLGISADVAALLREFGCSGEPILFIDGIDKVTDPATQLTINDILRTVANSDSLAEWRVLVTIREQNLKHLETWLDPDALKKLGLRTVAVEPLDGEELKLVGTYFPRLRPLIGQSGGPDFILKRPFFLNALLVLTGNGEDSQLPATEVELLKLWWEMGGSDRRDFSSAQYCRNLLIQAAEAIAYAPNEPVAIRALSPEALAELKSAGVLRDQELGHSAVFTHDIYQEWALCQLLIGEQLHIKKLLQKTGEPDALMRPMQLLGSYTLEMNSSPDPWKILFDACGNTALRPIWQRAVLTSCVQSTRTTQLLQKLTGYLLDNEAERLRKLLRAMETIEVLPNPVFLNERLTPGLEPEERARYANLAAVPKPLTWVRFLDWLMPQISTLPRSLVPDILPVFKTWQDAFGGRQVRHCREIGEISYGWLKEIEGAHHPATLTTHHRAFGGALLGRDAEKTIRALFLSCAGDVPKLASEYLSSKASDRKEVRVVREEILKNCVKLIIHRPADLVDFILAAFLEVPDERDDPFGGYSDHVFEELGIGGHGEFYPTSPVQLPFLTLLRWHEDQGLRLIRGLCNHSISIWRMAKERGRRYLGAATPIPITLMFPWGEQIFWGDGQVYLWFRGIWGNKAVESALMALEQWALEKLESGAAFEDIFRKVIDQNSSVAVLGIGVSLCLASGSRSPECAFPLVTCTYIWEWDIARVVQETTPTNEMGDWFHYRTQLTAVRLLNQKPHRRHNIRELIPDFVFSEDVALVERFTESVRTFPERLPISYEEEKGNPEHLESLRKQMVLFSEQADPQFWRVAPTADGEHIQVWSDPPSLQEPEYQEQQEQHVQLNAYLSVAMWANKSLENDNIEERMSLADALAKVRSWDAADLFDIRTDSFEERYRASAVAGTAYVAARACPSETWTAELASWCLDVIERAATGAEPEGNLVVRSASLLMHPAVFAAHGYSALLARGYETERCQRGLLNLAVDALQGVQIAALASAKYYASAYPDFYWVLLDLAFEQCIMHRDAIPDYHSIIWSQLESERKSALLDRAEGFLGSGQVPTLPVIPVPWVTVDEPASRPWEVSDGYTRNETGFMWDLAGKIFPHICLEPIFADPDKRAKFLILIGGSLEFTFQEIVPPFAASKRDYSGTVPYEWIFQIAAFCGKLCTYLPQDEVKALILSRVWAQDVEAALDIMQTLMRSFMIRAFLQSKEISEEHIALWTEMNAWLFACPLWVNNVRGDYLDREFTSCALSTLFCAASDFSPLICGIDPGWPHLRKFLPILQRAICEFGLNVTLYHAVITFLKRGGIDLLPEPALAWVHSVIIARKGDQKFWESNGENTVELVKQVISQKGEMLTPEHRKLITSIADILSDDGVRGAGFLQQELLRL